MNVVQSIKTACHLLAAALLLPLSLSLQAASLSISPIDPAIEDPQHAVALWLDNDDSVPVYLQVRVMRWSQEKGQDQWVKQTEIVASPPFTLLKQKQRQMIRLVSKTDVPAGEERAYRIIIDEIAQDQQKENSQQVTNLALGLNLKMRYVLPLFVTGKGIWTVPDPKKDRDPASATLPSLSYRLLSREGRQYVEISNRGAVHARLSAVTLTMGGSKRVLADGLLGYVLAGSTMSWPLPHNTLPSQGGQLEAMVNHLAEPIVIDRQ